MRNTEKECKVMSCVDSCFDRIVGNLPFPLQIPLLIVLAAPVVIVMWWQNRSEKRK